MKTTLINNSLVVLMLLPISAVAQAQGPAPVGTWSVKDLLNAAVANSARLDSAHAAEQVAALRKNLAETGYMPTVDAAIIDSTGFAGSTGQLGVGGIPGSSYRKGLGYGLTATDTLFDFGKTSRNIEGADVEVAARRAQTALTKVEVQRGALDAMLECSLAKSQSLNWQKVGEMAAITEKEVDSYVKTGQRSVVERELVRSQREEALRSADSLRTRLDFNKQRLQIITAQNQDCPTLDSIDDGIFQIMEQKHDPHLLSAETAVKAAEAEVRIARGGYLPKLVGLASVGATQDTRVVEEQNYAVGVALVVPLYDGSLTNVKVDSAQAVATVRQHELKAAQQEVDNANNRFQEEISTSKVELKRLADELKEAQKTLNEAKKRYYAQKGNLVDLREAIRNLTRSELEIANSKFRLLRAEGQRIIYGGGL